MRKILQKLPENFRSVATLIFGNSLAALFPILVAPFLTRIYTEEEFGIYTIFLSIVTIFCSFSTGRYDLAILESNTKSVVKHLAVLAFWLSIAISIIAFISLYSIGSLFSEFGNIQKIESLIYLVPFAILGTSVLQTINYVLNREKEFTQMAINKTFRTGVGSFTQLGVGTIGISFYGLAIGKFIGDLFAIVHGTILISKREILSGTQFQLSRIKYVSKKYEKYLRINSFHSFINVSTTSSIPLILGYFFSESIVGFYGLSFSVCFLPVTLISQAVFQIFSREFSVRIDEGIEVFSYFKSTVFKLALVSFPIFVVLVFFGDNLFEIIFGENWSTSGRFAQILAPYLFSSFVVSPFAFVALRLNKHAHIFRVELANIILRISSIIIGSIYFNEFIALVFFSISGLAVNVYLILWIAKIINLKRS